MIKLFVVGFPLDIQKAELMDIFSIYGTIHSMELLTDKYTQKNKGFGFVEMEDQAEAEKAIAAINGMVIKGRKLRVMFADEDRADKPRTPKVNYFHSLELQGGAANEVNDAEPIKNKRPRKLITDTFRAGN